MFDEISVECKEIKMFSSLKIFLFIFNVYMWYLNNECEEFYSQNYCISLSLFQLLLYQASSEDNMRLKEQDNSTYKSQ